MASLIEETHAAASQLRQEILTVRSWGTAWRLTDMEARAQEPSAFGP